MITEAPFFYNYQNQYESLINPSTQRITNTSMAYFFRKYLLQKVISVFKWTMPDNWTEPFYPLYCLYTFGWFTIIRTRSYGVIPQQSGLSGYGVFYQPTHVLIANPLLPNTELKIGVDCINIQLTPTYSGIMDIVQLYGDLMALAVEAGSVNLLNSRLAYFSYADNEADAKTYKKMIDDILSGIPAVVTDKAAAKKNLKTGETILPFTLFNTNIGSNFIAPDIWNLLNAIENKFDEQVGIPNANTEKRERLISDEVNSNNVSTAMRCDMWLQFLKQRIKEAKNMFGSDLDKLSVDWRYTPETEGGIKNESTTPS